MKHTVKIILLVTMIVCSLNGRAQVPYFAGTVGLGNVYGYTSIKVRPGVRSIESYNTFQFGLGDHFAIGSDVYIGGSSSYYGLLTRFGYKINPYFNIGVQITPSFSLTDGFEFSYLTNALYLNGAITGNGKLFWVSNTWYGVNINAKNTIDQWLYLGYDIPLVKNQSITPMVGTIYSWRFDRNADLAVGVYYSVSRFNIYIWTNDVFASQPRLVVGIDFTL